MRKGLHNICDEKIFEDIFKRYAKDLKRYIFFKTQDIKLTEDLLQETFIKLWDNCDNVSYGKVKSYLYTVATNLFLNHKKHEKVVRKFQSRPFNSVTNETPEFKLIEQEFLSKIEITIASLPAKDREVFLLNRLEKKKYKEIALMLQISIKTVEKRMHNALLVMKKEIGNV